MKKHFLLTYLFILTLTYSFGQNPTASYANKSSSANFGIKAGLNVSEQRFKLDIADSPFNLETSSTTSFHVGVFGEFMFSDNFGLNAEILYSREGSKIGLDLDIDSFEFKQGLDYLNIPVLLKYKVAQNKLALMAGPQFSFLLDDSIDLDANDGELLDPAYKSFDLGLVLGLEYEVVSRFLVGARYNLGLTDIAEDSEAGSSIKNSTLQIYLGYKLF